MKRIETIELETQNGMKEFDVYLGARELMFYERESEQVTGQERSFLSDIEKINKQPNMTTIVLIAASTLHEKGKKMPVGVDYLDKNINLFENMQTIMNAIGKCMADVNVKRDPSEKMGK